MCERTKIASRVNILGHATNVYTCRYNAEIITTFCYPIDCHLTSSRVTNMFCLCYCNWYNTPLNLMQSFVCPTWNSFCVVYDSIDCVYTHNNVWIVTNSNREHTHGEWHFHTFIGLSDRPLGALVNCVRASWGAQYWARKARRRVLRQHITHTRAPIKRHFAAKVSPTDCIACEIPIQCAHLLRVSYAVEWVMRYLFTRERLEALLIACAPHNRPAQCMPSGFA